MILDLIKKVWDFINGLNSLIKTLLIIMLFCYVGLHYIVELNQKIFTNYVERIEKQSAEDENYTLKVAHYINEYVYNILLGDEDCYNVLLLNYHNSLKSLQGFRYLYLNCLTENPKGLNNESLKEYWNDLEYVYYESELNRIRRESYLRVENIDSILNSFPKLYKKLLVSGAKAAAFYPIEGINSPIGMVVVLYKQPKQYSLGFYNSNIAPWVQKLSTILDYQNIKSELNL